MKYANESCPRNPKGTGHCDHTAMRETTGGTPLVNKCCWCGREHSTKIDVPAHGPYDDMMQEGGAMSEPDCSQQAYAEERHDHDLRKLEDEIERAFQQRDSLRAEIERLQNLLFKTELDAQWAVNERDYWKAAAEELSSPNDVVRINDLLAEVRYANRLLNAATKKMQQAAIERDDARAENERLRGLLREALDAHAMTGAESAMNRGKPSDAA